MFGWEIGSGLGHVTRLMKIARAVQAEGHEPVFVVRNLVEPWPVLKESGFPVIQAPVWQARPRPKSFVFKASSMADIIAWQSFDNADDLSVMVQAWQNVIELVRPDLIISDYSPTLNLAAHGVDPVFIIGDGFTLPPHDLETFPILRDAPNPVEQDRVFDVVCEVQRRRGRPPLKALPQVFEGAARFVCTYPELDPYRATRSEPAIGPFEVGLPPADLPNEQSFFAYIASDFKRFKPAVMGIGESRWPGSTYIRRVPRNAVKYLTQKGKAVYRNPAPMAEVLKQNRAILHHGGVGTTEQALAVGRPQVLLTRHMEQMLTGRALHELGVGVMVRGKLTPEMVGEGLRRAMEVPHFAERAQSVALDIQTRDYQDNVRLIADQTTRLLASGRRTSAAV